MLAGRAPREALRTSGIYSWALQNTAGTPCAGCGAPMAAGYQNRLLAPQGWTDVARRQWCLRCWSGGDSGDAAGPAGRGLGIPAPREP